MLHPNFEVECRICGTIPTVIVTTHKQPQTELCGPHFFRDASMFDWDLWNDQELNGDSSD